MNQEIFCDVCGFFHSSFCSKCQEEHCSVWCGNTRKRNLDDIIIKSYKKRKCYYCGETFTLPGQLDEHVQHEHDSEGSDEEEEEEQEDQWGLDYLAAEGDDEQYGAGFPRVSNPQISLSRVISDTIRVYCVKITCQSDVMLLYQKLFKDIVGLLKRELEQNKCVKVNIEMQAHFFKSRVEDDGFQRYAETDPNPTFHSYTHVLTKASVISKIVRMMFIKLQELVFEFVQHGSGWIFENVTRLELFVSTWNPLRGATFIPFENTLLEFIPSSTLLNIENEDEKCFMYAILAHEQISNLKKRYGSNASRYDRNPDTYSPFIHKVNFDGLSFPVELSSLDKFEKQNPNIVLTVIAYEEPRHIYNKFIDNVSESSNRRILVDVKREIRQCLYPIYVSQKTISQDTIHIDLLLVIKEEKDYWDGHYCLIRNLSAFLNTSQVRTQTFVCRTCLNCFHSESLKDMHWKYCSQFGLQKTDVPTEKTLKFSRYDRMIQVPFRYYADFESFLVPINSEVLNNQQTMKLSEHIPCGYAWICVDWEGEVVASKVYRKPNKSDDDDDVVGKFLQDLMDDYEIRMTQYAYIQSQSSKSMTIDAEQQSELRKRILDNPTSMNCYFCEKYFEDGKSIVFHHDHFSGDFLGLAHDKCNFTAPTRPDFPVFIHNFKSYDSHFIVQALDERMKVNVIPNSSEKFTSIMVNGLRFVDSLAFMNSSLEKLVSTLRRGGIEDFKVTHQLFSQKGPWEMLLSKGVYPYTYMKSTKNFEETCLPSIDCFYNDLTDTPLATCDYEYAQSIWNNFNIKNLGEWHDLYVLLDVALLADCMERTRAILWDAYDLDISHYFSLPMIAFDAVMKKGNAELEYLDLDMYIWMETAIRGGICGVGGKRAAKANNKYLGRLYNPEESDRYITYLDVNNLYGTAMSHLLPEKDFKWLDQGEINQVETDINSFLHRIPEQSGIGYFFEVDMEIDEDLHHKFNDYPPAATKRSIDEEEMSNHQKNQIVDLAYNNNIFKVSKLVADLHPKNSYVLHYETLRRYLRLGVRVTKVHKGLKFSQRAWMNPYINFNTENRKKAKTDFEKDFWKLLNNAAYGKCIEQKRKRQKMSIVTKPEQLQRIINNPTYQRIIEINRNVSIAVRKNTSVMLDKPIAVGVAILEISKGLMYDFHYDYMLQKYGNGKVNLLYTDTDSFVYEVETEDIYADMKNDGNYFDLSDYSGMHAHLNNPCNKKVLGKMKDEFPDSVIYKFIAAKPKMYAVEAVRVQDGNEEFIAKARAKGSGVGYGGGGNFGLGDVMDYHLDEDSPRGGHHPHSHHGTQQSLRRSRSRPSPVIYQTPTVGHSSENPYQQPYCSLSQVAGRSAVGLSDSPTSDNGSADTLTDSELPYPNNPALPPLQNGALLMGGGTLEFTNTGRLNSLKRPMNSNGKSQTGVGHNQHDTHLIDQFVMHAGGKVYIPSDTPKNSSSEYKTSPGSSPSKKTSGTLLYKDSGNMGTLRPPPPDSRQRSNKTDEDDFIYKVRGMCTMKKAIFYGTVIVLAISIIFNILYGTGTLPLGDDSDNTCRDGNSGDPYGRQSGSNATINAPHHPTPNHRAPPTPSAWTFGGHLPWVELVGVVTADDTAPSLYSPNWALGTFVTQNGTLMHVAYRMEGDTDEARIPFASKSSSSSSISSHSSDDVGQGQTMEMQTDENDIVVKLPSYSKEFLEKTMYETQEKVEEPSPMVSNPSSGVQEAQNNESTTPTLQPVDPTVTTIESQFQEATTPPQVPFDQEYANNGGGFLTTTTTTITALITTFTTTPPPPAPEWGGVCECYCPCLVTTNEDYVDEDDEEEGGSGGSGFSLGEIDETILDGLDSSSSGSGSGSGDGGGVGEDKLPEQPSSTSSAPPVSNDLEWLRNTLRVEEEGENESGMDEEGRDLTEENYIPVFPEKHSKSQTHYLDRNKSNCTSCQSAGGKYPGVNYPPDGTSFVQITIPTRLSHVIGPYSYWNMQFYQGEGAYVNWEFSVPRGASIGFYARRNALPSHTHYDFMEILRGFKTRNTRSAPPSVTKELNNFLEAGHWFLSMYNDDSDPQEVVFVCNISEEMTDGCPNGCSSNGQCIDGRCHCNAGFGSEDCSQSVCPVVCSGRGEYVDGRCQCNPGFKGRECSLRHDECESCVHGKCIQGTCACNPGFKGESCEEVECPHPTCNGHGICVNATCICKRGWRGSDCGQPDKDVLQCLPSCSNHGVFNLETQTCTCEPRWTGEDCSQELCDINCGPRGVCIDRRCQCDKGWEGELCNVQSCDPRCHQHGQCKNGLCLCVSGYNGIHCSLEGCPNSCSGHGQCKANMDGWWSCVCHNGYAGSDCSIMLEQNCSDQKDNDKDGLTDCEDPECCSSPHCHKVSQLCIYANKPTDILLRKQPPAITASFFEKMKFLIEEGSLQNYARQDAFNGSRSGVVRGRVVTPNGSGLMGVRVSSSSPVDPLGGFTMTQEDGWFDLMVNGGGAVTLEFGRPPFNKLSRTIFVPWNEVVIMDTVVMGSSSDSAHIPMQSCEAHDYELMRPVVLATWKHGFQGNCPGTSAILIESQVVQESLRIPGTGIYLMYHSSRGTGYLSTIQLQLTPETIPQSLKRVHLRITIEGVLYEKVFEADPGIRHTYAWNRLNVYRQRVYGVTTAIVKVGFEYDNCAQIIWDVQSTTLSGHDMGISDIGGWNLDIHHRYNFHEGIIQKGDGSNIYLKHRPRIIIPTMGNGHQRALDCPECNGVANKQKLLAPVALAAASDGTLFVGDFNLIRRIQVDGTVNTIVKLNATRVSYRYHMTLSPVDNTLYISDPESHQIIRVRNIDDFSDPEHNWEAVVGSGERCLPGDEAHCGDEALARDAKLAYPKGVAVSSDNVLFFADGTNIRKVESGIITTVIGNHQQKSHWKPIPCEGTLKVEEVHLRWPTELAVNPLDNSVYIIDDHMILKLTRDNRLRIIAGRPFHCPIPPGGFDGDLAIHTALSSPQSIAFASNGDLYVAESDSQRVNRIRMITTDGKIRHFAGADSKCNCLDRGCSCYDDDHYLAATCKFSTISSIAMAPDGILHIADQGNYRVRSVMALIPQPSAGESKQYEIYSPETQEIYIFNRFGQHVATKNIVTGETIYTFLYNVNMSNGKLSSVTDAAGNKIQILRDYSSQVKTIENAQAQKFNLRMSQRSKMLQEFSSPEGYNYTFDYHGSSGLIKSRQDSSGRASVYSYDEFGRLIQTVSPTGQVINLGFDLSKKGASVKVTKDHSAPEIYFIKGSSVTKRVGKWEQLTAVQDTTVIIQQPWGQTVTTESVPYNLLGEINPALSDSFPIPGKQKTELGTDLVNRVEWRYIARKEGRGKNKQVVQVDKKLRINGDNVLMVEYERESKSELLYIDDRIVLLNVTYDKTGRPLKWIPRDGFATVEVEHDRFGRLVGWNWDQLSEAYEYDRGGRISKIRYADGTSLSLTFKELMATLPKKMTTAGGSDYLLEYDDAGAFQSLTTPRGHIHTFGLATAVGVYEYQYRSPSSRDVYRIQYNDNGEVVSILYPQNSGRVNYVYNRYGKLEICIAGLRSTRFFYQENLGLVKSAEVSQSSFELKTEYKYHGGNIKEQREKFGTKSGLDNVHLKFQYDGNGRVSSIETELGGKSIQTYTVKRNQNTGNLETVGDLKILGAPHHFNRTVIEDSSKSFFLTSERDTIGRLREMSMMIKGAEVYKMNIQYDTRGKLKHRKLDIRSSVYADNVRFDEDGHVAEVKGSGHWKYSYDENGNDIQIMEQGEKSSLIYDSGDRVIQVGELLRYTYDARGFLVQRGAEKYQYDDKGHLIQAVKKDDYKVWFFYDHLDRLISWKDDKGNVTQFIYADPHYPHLLTHVHYPVTGFNLLLLHDQNEHLVSMVTSKSHRFYVATDQNKSPLAVFTHDGNLVKEIHRSPFGKLVRDSAPEFYLPIDFHGGIVDKHTGILIINGRPYDATIGQWMVPLWHSLSSQLRKPTDIFTYRFMDNDPITPHHWQITSRMTSLDSWLKIYGFDMDNIVGKVYTVPQILGHVTNNAGDDLTPEFGVVSGLNCMAQTTALSFKNVGFNRQSKLNPERAFSSKLIPQIAYRKSGFGPGLLISRADGGRALVSTVDNSVVQGVITSVLNGSIFIEFRSTHQNSFYFVKDNPHKLRDDTEELKRLGGHFNISVHDAENGIKELKLWSGDATISVRYGADEEEERSRLLKHAHRRAIEKAWEEEKHYISLGLDGRRAWAEDEKEQLLSKGLVHGYRPTDLFSIHKYPHLADDPNNVIFQKDSRRKRRNGKKNKADRRRQPSSRSL